MINSKILKPMGYICCFFFILCFIAIIYLILSDDELVCKYQPVDYYILSFDSIPSNCIQTKCSRLSKRSNLWRIHGLWPSNYKSTTEFCCRKGHKDSSLFELGLLDACCQNTRFNYSELDKISEQLLEVWPDLRSKNASSFWSYEWEKHGTCALSNPKTNNLFEYFNTTLTLFEKFSIQKWLENKMIRPGNKSSNKVSSKLFREAIESQFGAKIYMICHDFSPKPSHFSRIEKDEMSIISTIRLCLDKNFNPINCRSLNRKCKDQIIYPDLGFI